MRILTIEQMKVRKQVLGYSNEQLSILSGVPESTIQKIFSGTTKFPFPSSAVTALSTSKKSKKLTILWKTS